MRPITLRAPEDYGYDYNDLIDSMEIDVLVEVSDDTYTDAYTGDTRALIRHNGALGILTYGWGSCSGCDALADVNCQAEPTRTREATELRDDIWRGIHWEPTPSAMTAYIENKDWSLDYHGPGLKPFLAQALDTLRALDPTTGMGAP